MRHYLIRFASSLTFWASVIRLMILNVYVLIAVIADGVKLYYLECRTGTIQRRVK